MGIFSIFSRSNSETIINTMDNLLGDMERALTVLRNGIKNYLYGDMPEFTQNLTEIATIESAVRNSVQEIEHGLYTRGYLVRFRGDVMRLLERFEHIVSLVSVDLVQFEIESPKIPLELRKDFIKLAELATMTVEACVPATQAFFRDPESVPENVSKVYYFDHEAMKLSQSIKRKVFHDMEYLKLSEKFHLRYFALHIEELSSAAVKVAEQLSVMAIKRSL